MSVGFGAVARCRSSSIDQTGFAPPVLILYYYWSHTLPTHIPSRGRPGGVWPRCVMPKPSFMYPAAYGPSKPKSVFPVVASIKFMTVQLWGVVIGFDPVVCPDGTHGTLVQVRTYASVFFSTGSIDPSALACPEFGEVTDASSIVGAWPLTQAGSPFAHSAYAAEKEIAGVADTGGTSRSTSPRATWRPIDSRVAATGGKNPAGACTLCVELVDGAERGCAEGAAQAVRATAVHAQTKLRVFMVFHATLGAEHHQ